MFRILLIGIALLAGAVSATETSTEPSLKSTSLRQLEERLEEIDTELARLAPISLRSGVGAVGYRSASNKKADHPEWVQIELGDEVPIDQIVLVPTLGRDSKAGLEADGFPLEFRILAGTTHTTNVVASFTTEDDLLPRIAPVSISFDHIKASWVRLECTLLSPRSGLRRYHRLQLSEVMIFNGRINVALQKPVKVSSSNTGPARHERFLVDGFVPYLMDAAHGEKSASFAFPLNSDASEPSFTIDLGAAFPLNQINLHAVDLSRNIPESVTDDYAFPQRLRVTGANNSDFSDQTLLFEYVRRSLYDAGPVIMRNFPEASCRYVRITAIDFQPSSLFGKTPRIGFAEIEILSNSKNVAQGRPIIASSGFLRTGDRLNRMTDGNNFYGEILPVQDWMNQLARRHDLETERPKVSTELSHRYARQKAKLRLAVWSIVFLLGAAVILVLVEQLLRQRAVTRTRERIAANLHDELGANLHAIGILGTYAKKVMNSPEKLARTVDEIKALTDRTGAATRYCTEMQTAKEAHPNLADDLQRTARRMIANLECDFILEGEEFLKSLSPRNRSDLYLFFKESLININRHADATAVKITLTADPKKIYLSISDNGCGISENEDNTLPASLKRRGKLLKANATIDSPKVGGTRITLQFRPRKFGYKKSLRG